MMRDLTGRSLEKQQSEVGKQLIDFWLAVGMN